LADLTVDLNIKLIILVLIVILLKIDRRLLFGMDVVIVIVELCIMNWDC